MRHFFIFIISLSICNCFIGCRQTNKTVEGEGQFKIIGMIDDTTVDTVFFRYWRCEKDNEEVKGTILVTNGTFTIEGIGSSRTNGILSISNKEIFLYLDPGEMQLYLKKDSLENFVLKGSQTQADKEMLETQTKPLEDYLSKIKRQLSSEKSEQNYEFLTQQKDSINNLLENIWIDFITSHPSSHYSLDVIANLFFNKLNADTLTNLFNGLSENVRVSCSGKQIYSFILQRQKAAMTDVSSLEAFGKGGTLIKLSDFEGKYILLDFWASWCVPCIKGFPHLRELYAKYKDNGLIVISISVDRKQDEQKWLDAIEKNDISEWIHILSCENNGENNMCDLLETGNGIPHQILIDKSGNVVKRWTGFGEAVVEEQNEMFGNIFENKK